MRLWKPTVLLGVVVLFSYFFLFKDILLGSKVLFPSNFLVQFYSPYKSHVFPGWEQGIPHKPIGTDQLRFFAPSREFSIEELKKGNIPFWNPYIFSGNPHIADFQSAVFSPVTLLFLALPFWTSWNIFIVIQPLFAAIGMWLYLGRLSLSRPAKVLGVLSFALSGFVTVWVYENSVVAVTGIYMPFILWAFERFVEKRNFGSTLLLILFLVLCVYSGFFQLAFYIYAFTGVYMLVRFLQNKSLSIRALIFMGIVLVTSLLLAAPQLVPSIEGYNLSARTKSSVDYLFDTYLLDPLHFLKILTPDLQGSPASYNYFGKGFYHETVLFIGTVPFLVALFAFYNFRNRFVLIFSALLLVTLLLAFKSPLTDVLYSQPIPLLSTFVPSRVIFLSTVALAVLSAFGADMLSKANKRYKITVASLFLLIQVLVFGIGFSAVFNTNIIPQQAFDALGLGGEYFVRNSSALFRNSGLSLFFGVVFLSFLLFIRNKRTLYLVILLLSSAQLIFYYQKYMVKGESEFIYPKFGAFQTIRLNQGFDRTVAIGDHIQSNILLHERIYSPEGLDPIFPYEYGVLAYSAKFQKFTLDIPRIEVNISDQQPQEFLKNDQLQKFLRMTSVKYILYFTKDTEPTVSAEMKLVKEDTNWKLYEVGDRLPRVFFADTATVSSSLEDRVEMTLSPERLDSEIVLEKQAPEFSPPEKDDIVGIAEYEPKKVTIRSLNSGSRLIFFSDSYYPRWKAYVNGVETEIYRANTAFRAIRVPPGDNFIEFEYDPRAMRYGLNLMIGGLLLLAIIWYSFSIRKQ